MFYVLTALAGAVIGIFSDRAFAQIDKWNRQPRCEICGARKPRFLITRISCLGMSHILLCDACKTESEEFEE